MRLALISDDWIDCTGGGIATLTAALAGALHEAGVKVEVWTRGGGSRGRSIEQRASSALPHSFSVRALVGRNWRARGQAHWRRGLPSLLAEFRPDGAILTTWEPLAALEDSLDACGGGARPQIAVMAHGRDITGEVGPARTRRRELAWGSAVGWLVLTPWMAQQLGRRGVPARQIFQVPAVVPERPRQPDRAPQGAATLLTVGRLIPRKGQDVVIEAVSLLAEKYPILTYVVVGAGPDCARLKRLARAFGVEDRVQIRGWLPADQLEQAWQAADLFVMPAREEARGDTEGYGLVYLEAGARGLAVVGARSGGVPAAVRPSDNGELVNNPRSASELASLLDSLLGDPQRVATLGAAGRRAFEERGRPPHLAHRICEIFAMSVISP